MASNELWSRIPVDDVGYFQSSELMMMSDADLRSMIDQMERTRYGGWRNYQNRWRDIMGLDSAKPGTRIVDFGCGVGMEALQFAKRGCAVTIADQFQSTVELAERVLRLYGFTPRDCLLISQTSPYVECEEQDIFYANGVLHHIPHAVDVMRRAA